MVSKSVKQKYEHWNAASVKQVNKKYLRNFRISMQDVCKDVQKKKKKELQKRIKGIKSFGNIDKLYIETSI